MEQSLSDKIRIGTFLCTVLVVLRHSLNLQAFDLTKQSDSLAFYHIVCDYRGCFCSPESIKQPLLELGLQPPRNRRCRRHVSRI